MFSLQKAFKLSTSIKNTHIKAHQVRTFWEYVNMMFNKPDENRIKSVGADRACAEWVLRNGGAVVWHNGKRLSDYNALPPEEEGVPKIIALDASNSSISHYGFAHLKGCSMLKKVILHNCSYVDDRALQGLTYGKDTLTYVQVSSCLNVTDPGIKSLQTLSNLEILVLYNLPGVSDLNGCKLYLQKYLQKCKFLDDTQACNENEKSS